MAKLQAQCATYLRNLQQLWDEAKKEDAMKVDMATSRAEELTRQCEEVLRNCEQYCETTLRKTENHAQLKKSQLEEKVAAMDDLAKQRVAMMQRQSKERRQKAEVQLAEFLAHVEEVRTQCAERVRTEAVTADEKVEMARQRFDSEVALAERRQAEAEARRDAARASHAAVMARCIGSAMEARRRGLNNIAEIIEPEPPRRYPGYNACMVAAAEALANAGVEALPSDDVAPLADTTAKDGLLNTGFTGASTAPPNDTLMASIATSNGEAEDGDPAALPDATQEKLMKMQHEIEDLRASVKRLEDERHALKQKCSELLMASSEDTKRQHAEAMMELESLESRLATANQSLQERESQLLSLQQAFEEVTERKKGVDPSTADQSAADARMATLRALSESLGG